MPVGFRCKLLSLWLPSIFPARKLPVVEAMAMPLRDLSSGRLLSWTLLALTICQGRFHDPGPFAGHGGRSGTWAPWPGGAHPHSWHDDFGWCRRRQFAGFKTVFNYGSDLLYCNDLPLSSNSFKIKRSTNRENDMCVWLRNSFQRGGIRKCFSWPSSAPGIVLTLVEESYRYNTL